MCLRDEMGSVIFSACRFLESRSEAFEAEVLACLEGLALSVQHSQLLVIIDSDNGLLVAAIKDIAHDRSPYLHVIDEIKRLSSVNRVCNFAYVDRGQGRVSHCLANWARAECRTSCMLRSSPDVFP
jgi:hypothetical protein